MKVALDKSFYPLPALDEAAAEVAALARFTVKVRGAKVAIEVDGIDPDVGDVLVDEFLNYALGLAIAGRE